MEPSNNESSTKIVTTVIVNYATGYLLEASIKNLIKESKEFRFKIQIVIVDNASPDNSVSVINDFIKKNKWNESVLLIAEKENHGFAKGNNVAFRYVLSSSNDYDGYFFCLNPDATIRPRAIYTLLEYLMENTNTGVVGSKLINEDNTPRASSFNDPSIIREFQRGAELGFIHRNSTYCRIALPSTATPKNVDWVSGAAFMFHAKLLKHAGFMDESFFLYFEEAEFMRRVRKVGFKVTHNPLSLVVHLAGQSTKIKNGVAAVGNIPEYWYRSWKNYYIKTVGRGYMSIAGLAWIAGRCLRMTLYKFKGKKITDGHRLSDFIKFALLEKSKNYEK